jgi:hypothetical protein
MSDGRFAGVDWASEEHAVCVVDGRGRIVEGRRYRHSELGIRALCVRLVRSGVALVALERPDGLLIERLLDAGLSVVAVHPNQVKASRPRYSIAGGKSDTFDSFVLAELARRIVIVSGCCCWTATRRRRCCGSADRVSASVRQGRESGASTLLPIARQRLSLTG